MSLQLVWFVGGQVAQAPAWLDNVMSSLAEESIVACEYLGSLVDAEARLSLDLPDLVLLMAEGIEAVGQDVNAFCAQVRNQAGEYRPVLVVQTNSLDEETRIAYLISGADDTLSTEVSAEELRIRLLVHLRRNLDVLSNRVTRLPGRSLCSKVLQRRMNRHEAWGLLLIDIQHIEPYIEVYGQIPGNQVLKTFAALLGNLVLPPDFVGHLEAQTFVVITHADQAEKVAALLCKQFDSVVKNFYAKDDQRRGYIVSIVEDRVSRRVGFLSLAIGIVGSAAQPLETYQAGFTLANQMKRLALLQTWELSGSHWVSDRIRLAAPASPNPEATAEKKAILVVESDAALAFLLKATLELQNYDVDSVSNIVDAQELIHARRFDLVLLDALLNGESVGWEFCQRVKQRSNKTLVILLSTVHDRQRAMEAGADVYLPKPFELVSLFTWIDRLLRGASAAFSPAELRAGE
jgi:DNA-binding response OmpR family regulator